MIDWWSMIRNNGYNEFRVDDIENWLIQKGFHWYEGSLQHIILWYSYIGINIELIEYTWSWSLELYLLIYKY